MNGDVKNQTMNPVFPERIVRIFYSLFSETNAENRNPCNRKGLGKFKIWESTVVKW
jgi:hypothetical protein